MVAAGLMLLLGADMILAAAVSWFVSNAGYETTDDATVEAHAIQVSPKVSAHVKTVHFDDNYEVKRGDLLLSWIRGTLMSLWRAPAANLASAQSKLTESEAQQNVAQAGLGQTKADLASAQATAENQCPTSVATSSSTGPTSLIVENTMPPRRRPKGGRERGRGHEKGRFPGGPGPPGFRAIGDRFRGEKTSGNTSATG